MNTIDFTQGPFIIEWQSFRGTDHEVVSVINANNEVIECFDDDDANLADDLRDWLNANHKGNRRPMPLWYKDLLEHKAREEAYIAALNVEYAQSFDDYAKDDIPY